MADQTKIKEVLSKAIKNNEAIKTGLSKSPLNDLIDELEDISQVEPNIYNHSFTVEFPRSRKYIPIFDNIMITLKIKILIEFYSNGI